jgi:hypothetical protein
MSSGPETRFIASVHRHLPPLLHREKMANPYRGGTADSWYSGVRGDLWIEWKFVELPKRDETEIDLTHCTPKTKPILAALQQDWIMSRIKEGRRVWVGVGCKEGCVFFTDLMWAIPHTAAWYRRNLCTRQDAALQIWQICQGP